LNSIFSSFTIYPASFPHAAIHGLREGYARAMAEFAPNIVLSDDEAFWREFYWKAAEVVDGYDYHELGAYIEHHRLYIAKHLHDPASSASSVVSAASAEIDYALGRLLLLNGSG
jgi:hypothetical protein